jgi:hypothetical protein
MAQLPQLSPTEKMTFCRTGILPARLQTSTGKQFALLLTTLFEQNCPCGGDAPVPIRTARLTLQWHNPKPSFPNLFIKYGEAEYNDAVKALEAYRAVKPFHKKWSALRTAARASHLGLAENGLDLSIELSQDGWDKFALTLGGEMRAKLQAHVQSVVEDHVKSKLSERSVIRLEKVLVWLDVLETLKSIWEGAKNKELANKKQNDPAVFDAKLKFFIAIMATQGKLLNKGMFDRLLQQYRAYDKAFWPVWDYATRENALRAGVPERSTHPTIRSPKTGGSAIPEADLGIGF